MRLRPSPLDLAGFMQVVADIVRVKADEKDLLFAYEPSGELPRTALADEKRLRQVLLNLLSNAVKFTDQGQVTLRLHADAVDAAQVRLRFEVRDSGIGMAADDLVKIFRPFEQASSVERRAAGTGLGLAISQALVRQMGGVIEVDSAPGAGSRFRFDIELPVVDDAVAPPAEAPVIVGYCGPRKRLLVADDVAPNRALLRDLLGAIGFEVVEAADGEEAWRRALEWQPDLILMDNVMPQASGADVTRRLRERPEFVGVPIVSISAGATEADQQRSLAAGASAFLPKPIELAALLQVIGQLLQVTWVHQS